MALRAEGSCTDERIPSEVFNGYGEYVADLYKDMSGEKLFM